MAKPVRFTPQKTIHGTWRLNIPAKFAASGKRERHFYSTKQLALDAASKLKEQRQTFGSSSVAIAPHLAEQATAAASLLEPLGIALLEAVRRFVAAENRERASMPIETAIADFRASGATKWSSVQDGAYRIRGDKLIEAFAGRMVSTITGEELRKHLEQTTGSASTFNHAMRLVRAIWRWWAKPPRKWCDAEAVAHLEIKATVSGEVGTLTPSQAEAIMSAAVKHFPDCVAPFAIALFTGMRQAEIERLTPRDITSDGLTVPATSAKTKRRRFVQMPEPLAAWLEAYPVGDAVCPPDWTRKERAVRRLAGFKVWSNLMERLDPPQEAAPPDNLPEWPSNGLRHTAATVALAMGKPIETLVFEHGHSGGLTMLRKHYAGAMPKKDAIAIWAIRPEAKKAKKTSHLKIA